MDRIRTATKHLKIIAIALCTLMVAIVMSTVVYAADDGNKQTSKPAGYNPKCKFQLSHNGEICLTDMDGKSMIGRYKINAIGNVNYYTKWEIMTDPKDNDYAVGKAKNSSSTGYEEVIHNDYCLGVYYNFSSTLSKRLKTKEKYHTVDYYSGTMDKNGHRNKYPVYVLDKINSGDTNFGPSDIAPNSSSAKLSPKATGSSVAKAYLVWYVRDSNTRYSYSNGEEVEDLGYLDDPVLFFTPAGRQWVYPTMICADERGLYCLAADVTQIVQTQGGYGNDKTYGVGNIPYWFQRTTGDYREEYNIYGINKATGKLDQEETDDHGSPYRESGGSNSGSWNLITIEENDSFPLSAVKININSEFMDCDYSDKWKNAYETSVTLRGFKTETIGKVQLFASGIMGNVWDSNGGSRLAYATAYKLGSSPSKNFNKKPGNVIGSSNANSIQGLENASNVWFGTNEIKDKEVGDTSQINVAVSNAKRSWDTYCCIGACAEVKCPDITGSQRTKLKSKDGQDYILVTGSVKNSDIDPKFTIQNGNLEIHISELIAGYFTAACDSGTLEVLGGTGDTLWYCNPSVNRDTRTVTISCITLANNGEYKYSIKIPVNNFEVSNTVITNYHEFKGNIYYNGSGFTNNEVINIQKSHSTLELVFKITLDNAYEHTDTYDERYTDYPLIEEGTKEYYEYYAVGYFATDELTATIDRINIPKRDFAQFLGYYTKKDCTGEQIIDENGTILNKDPTRFKKDTKLYAKWGPAVYKVTLDNQGADTGKEGTRFIYEKYGVGWYWDLGCTQLITSPITIPEKKANEFLGYSPNKDKSDVDCNNCEHNINSSGVVTCTDNNVLINKDVTWYAHYKGKPIIITLDPKGNKSDSVGVVDGTRKIVEEYGICYLVEAKKATSGHKTKTYDYTGGMQTFKGTYPGKYYLQVWGAQGGGCVSGLDDKGRPVYSGKYAGGKGGYSAGVIELREGESIFIYVGGKGEDGKYGWHGGGEDYDGYGGTVGYNGGTSGRKYYWAIGGGGGATDIKVGNRKPGNRVIVAGGGGGAASSPKGAKGVAGGSGTGTDEYSAIKKLVHSGGQPQDPDTYQAKNESDTTKILGIDVEFKTSGDDKDAGPAGGGGGYQDGRSSPANAHRCGNGVDTVPAGEGGTGYQSDKIGDGKIDGDKYKKESDTGVRSGDGYAKVTYAEYKTIRKEQNSITIPERLVSKTDNRKMKFTGYYTTINPEDGDKVIDENGNIIVSNTYFTEDATIYAGWDYAPNNNTLEYDGNGANSGSIPSTNVRTKGRFEINYNKDYGNGYTKFVRTGYEFSGYWTKNADGTGGSYIEGQKEVPSSDFFKDDDNGKTEKVYAKWTPKEYKIEYISNDDSLGNWNSIDSVIQSPLYVDQPVTLFDGSIFTRNGPISLSNGQRVTGGYTFIGWGTTPYQTSPSYSAGQTIPKGLSTTGDETIKLYAIWKKTITLTLDPAQYGASLSGSTAPIVLSADVYNATYGAYFNIDTYYGSFNLNGVNAQNTYVNGEGVTFRFLGWNHDTSVAMPYQEPEEKFDVFSISRVPQVYLYDNDTIHAMWEPVLQLNGNIFRKLNVYPNTAYADGITHGDFGTIKVETSDLVEYSGTKVGLSSYTEVEIDPDLTYVYELARSDGNYTEYDDTYNDGIMDEGYSLYKFFDNTYQGGTLVNPFSSSFYIPQYALEFQNKAYGGIKKNQYGVTMRAVNEDSYYWNNYGGQDEVAEITGIIYVANTGQPTPGGGGGGGTDEEHDRLKYSLRYGDN